MLFQIIQCYERNVVSSVSESAKVFLKNNFSEAKYKVHSCRTFDVLILIKSHGNSVVW